MLSSPSVAAKRHGGFPLIMKQIQSSQTSRVLQVIREETFALLKVTRPRLRFWLFISNYPPTPAPSSP